MAKRDRDLCSPQVRSSPLATESQALTPTGQIRRVRTMRSNRPDAENVDSRKRFGDVAQRREVRRRLRGLQAEVVGGSLQEDFGIGSSKFEVILDASEKTLKETEGQLQPREQLVGAELLDALSAGQLRNVHQFCRRNAPTPAEFVAALRRKFMRAVVPGAGTNDGAGPSNRGRGARGAAEEAAGEDGGRFDWVAMGRQEALALIRPAATFQTMVGPMEAEAPKRRAVGERRLRREEKAETVIPQQLKSARDRSEEGGEADNRDTVTEATVLEMRRCLKKRRSSAAPLAHLLLSRKSFAQTVENMFALSFLVKEGHVELMPASNGEEDSGSRVVAKLRDRDQDNGAGSERKQFIMRLDISDWQTMKEQVPEGGELMPARVMG